MYTLLLVALTVGLLYGVSQRMPLDLDVIRDRNSLYRETNEGLIENVYTLKIINMDESTHRYQLEVSGEQAGIEGLELELNDTIIEVESGEVLNFPVSVRVDPVALKHASAEIEFILYAEDAPDKLHRRKNARFLGPVTSR
jgi:polyferredoxin